LTTHLLPLGACLNIEIVSPAVLLEKLSI